MLQGSGLPLRWSGVFDPDTERARAFSDAIGAPLARSEEEVLEGSDAVYVCTWTAEHRRLVEAAAARGLAIFCEKPLAVDLEGARAMTRSVEKAGVVNQVGLVLRYSPAFEVARALILAPESGRVMAVVFRDDQFIPTQGAYGSAWRADRERAGSGTLLEHSIHDLDLLEWLLGPVCEVNARTAFFHGLEGIEDVATVSLAFESGALGTLISVWHDLLERPSLRRLEVFCERAYVVVEGDWLGPVSWTRPDGDAGSLEGAELAEAAACSRVGPANPAEAFLRCAAERRPATPDFRTALRAHELADAVYRSAALGGSPARPSR